MNAGDAAGDLIGDFRVDEVLLRRRVRRERLATLLASANLTVLPALCLGLVTVCVFWPVVDHGLLIAWYCALGIAYGLRVVAARRFAGTDEPELERYERWVTVIAAMSGAIWGAITLVPLPQQTIEYEAFLGFLVSGIVATSIPSLGSDQRIAFAFVVPSVLPLAGRLLLHLSSVGFAMGLMVVLYLFILYVAVRRNDVRLEQSMQQRIEAEMQRAALALSRAQLQRQQTLTDIISRAQSGFIAGRDSQALFSSFLDDLVDFNACRHGMVVSVTPDEDACLSIFARSSSSAQQAVELPCELQTALQDQLHEPAPPLSTDVIAKLCACAGWNVADVATMTAVPLRAGTQLVGMILLAHEDERPFDTAALYPLATTVAQLLVASRAEAQRSDAQRHLDRMRAQLETCITDTPASVAMLDRSLCVIAHSQQLVRDFGVASQVLTGRRLYEAVPDIPLRWREAFARVMSGETECFEEDPFIRHDGSVCWLRWQARPWYEPGGQVGGLVLFTDDVTERKKATDAVHARERLLEQLTGRVPGLLFQMRVRADGARSLLYVSSGSLRLLGMTPDVLIENPQRIFEVCAAEDREELDAAFVRARHSGVLSKSFRTRLANDEMRRLSVQADATRLADGSAIWHGYIQDITDRDPIASTSSGSGEVGSDSRHDSRLDLRPQLTAEDCLT